MSLFKWGDVEQCSISAANINKKINEK